MKQEQHKFSEVWDFYLYWMKANNKMAPVELANFLDPRLEEKIIALPLQFEYLPVEIISKEFTKLNSPHPYRIHYLGPRFTNTLYLHKKYSAATSAASKQPHLFEQLYGYSKYEVQMRKIVQSNYLNEKLQDNHYYKSAIFYRAFEGMNPTLNRQEEMIFNSCFESGNLDCVIKVQQTEFDLFLRIDSNTRGHAQWFYFSVQNGKKLGNYTFNICNVTKPNTLYEQGMRPYVFSKKKHEKSGRKWEQDGANVELVERKLRYSLIEEVMESPHVFKLSFDYVFDEEDDEVFFAYSLPYTYSQMIKDISLLPAEYVKRQVLGRSLTGVQIPILHISNHNSQGQQGNTENTGTSIRKKNVLITGRIHPGESNGSHVLKGFIQFLCSSNPKAIELRNRMNFFIIPMVNPDGVIMGNSRSCASGKDLNREYLGTKKQLYPQVHLVKNLAFKLQKHEGLLMFFDFHGHSRKKNTFFYGPSYSLSEPEYYKSRALAKLIQKINPNFRYYSCSFAISEQKKKTARAVLFDQIKIPYVFTIESSIGLFYDCAKLRTAQYTQQEWNNTGSTLTQGLSDFIVAYEEYEEIIRERRLQRKKRKERLMQTKKANGKKFIEEDPQMEDMGSDRRQPSMLMFELLEEIKQQPTSKNTPIHDMQASSDDHDDAEDLQSSKLAEFNNLVINSKQKDQMSNPSRLTKVPQEIDESIIKPKRVETETDELQLAKEINQQIKRSNVKVQVKGSSGSSNSNIQSNNIISNKVGPTERMPRRNATFGSKSMKIGEEANPKAMREQCRQRKSINFQTHRHLISKQFFPLEKCEFVELPKSSIGPRKELKGRVMIQEYLSDKKKEKQQRQKQVQKAQTHKQEQKGKTLPQSDKNIRHSHQEHTTNSSGHMKKFKIEDLRNSRVLGNFQKNRFMDRRIISMGHTTNFSHSATPKKEERNMRIFDTILFSSFKGMEIDNMAMMIRTFNKG